MNPTLPNSMLQDVNKMKGDAIGDTMYSGRWVLKALMKLSQKYMEYTSPDDYQLESDLEGDLGLLWDMTIEPDVAQFLVENNALELITDVVIFSRSPRLTEIMIGILGNLACQENVRQKVGSNTDLIKVIINLLKFTDSPTLVQLVRLLKTCIWDVGKKTTKKDDASSTDEKKVGNESCWINSLKMESELLYQSLIFILASSRNEDLLCSTLGLIESLFNATWYEDDYFIKHFSTEECIKALLEAINEINSHCEDKAESFMNNRKLKEASAHWVSILHRMTYHRIGMNALENQTDAVFGLVNTIWVEQSAKSGHLSSNHIVHLILAVELLGALLPMHSQPYKIRHVLAILSTANQSSSEEEFGEEEEKVDTGDLKETLEDFCFLVAKKWKLDSEVELSDLRHYSDQEITLLVKILMKKLGKTLNLSVNPDDLKLSELKNIIANIPDDK